LAQKPRQAVQAAAKNGLAAAGLPSLHQALMAAEIAEFVVAVLCWPSTRQHPRIG